MKITEHIGYSPDQAVNTLVEMDVQDSDVARDNTGQWFIRVTKESDAEGQNYVSYWITFTDAEAKSLKSAINYLLKHA